MTTDTVESVVKIGGLILTALGLLGGGIKVLFLSGGGADLVSELRKQQDDQKIRIESLERDLDEQDERHRSELADMQRRYEQQVDALTRTYRDEIDKLQREVRDLMKDRRPRP